MFGWWRALFGRSAPASPAPTEIRPLPQWPRPPTFTAARPEPPAFRPQYGLPPALPAARQSPAATGIKLILLYADVDGVITERTITLVEIEGRMAEGKFWPNLLHAWCHLRQDNRHFAVSRIQRLTDPITGDVFDKKVEIVGFFRVIAPGDVATADDRRFMGYRELDRAAHDRRFLATRPVVHLTWQPARSRAKPKRRKATINSVCNNRLGEPYAFFLHENETEWEKPYFIFPDGSGVRRVLLIEEMDKRIEGSSLGSWLSGIQQRGTGHVV